MCMIVPYTVHTQTLEQPWWELLESACECGAQRELVILSNLMVRALTHYLTT